MTELLRTSFSGANKGADGRYVFDRDEIIGRGVLGWFCWALMSDLQKPMTSWATEAWAKAVRRNPRASIVAFNKDREDVDVDQVMRMIGGARKSRGDGEN